FTISYYVLLVVNLLFFLNEPHNTEIYTLSLHDALPIYLTKGIVHIRKNIKLAERILPLAAHQVLMLQEYIARIRPQLLKQSDFEDRKSTRLNSSHVKISYAVFCLKKKNKRARID